jgi:broad specificity phosphatase PhoE
LLRSVDGFAVVGSSEQRRAMGSAELVAQRFPAARHVRVKELHEMKYGDLETGQNFWKSDRLLCGI